MSPMETPGHVERMARRLSIMVDDTEGLARRLQGRNWSNDQLEDLKTASTLLAQAQDLLKRHARRWRSGGEE